MGLHRARPLSRVSRDRAERVLLRLDRLHEREPVGRARRGAADGRAGKGIIEHDLATQRAHVPPARRRRARSSTCRAINARGMNAAELDRRRSAQRVDDVRRRHRRQDRAPGGARRAAPRRARARSQGAARLQAARARTSISTRAGRRSSASRRAARRATAVARRHRAREAARARCCRADVDRDALVELGLRYLQRRRGRATPTAAALGRRWTRDAPQQPPARQLPPARDTLHHVRRRADRDHRRRTARARRRSSRRSRGRCTATRRRAARASRSGSLRAGAARQGAAWSSTSSSAGHRYRVVRGLTSAELYLDGAEQPIANSHHRRDRAAAAAARHDARASSSTRTSRGRRS